MEKIIIAEAGEGCTGLGILKTIVSAETTDGKIDFTAGQKDDEEKKKKLLKKSMDGEPVKVTARFLAYISRTNLNFWRIPEDQLAKFSASATSPFNRPFMKDHNLDQDKRGGTIIASEVVELETSSDESAAATPVRMKGVIHTVELVKPWAVQGVLDGTVDRVSVGVQIREDTEAVCSECRQDLIKEGWCGHIRGADSKKFKGTKIEHILKNAYLKELSAVCNPAELDAGKLDVIARESEKADEVQVLNYAAFEENIKAKKSDLGLKVVTPVTLDGKNQGGAEQKAEAQKGEGNVIAIDEHENFYSFKVRDASLFVSGSFRREEGEKAGLTLIVGRLNSTGEKARYMLRFAKPDWNVTGVDAWIKAILNDKPNKEDKMNLKELVAEHAAEDLIEAHQGLSEVVDGLKKQIQAKDDELAKATEATKKIEDELKHSEKLVAELEDKRAEDIKASKENLATAIVTMRAVAGKVTKEQVEAEIQALLVSEIDVLKETFKAAHSEMPEEKVFGKANASEDGQKPKSDDEVMADAVTNALLGKDAASNGGKKSDSDEMTKIISEALNV